MNMAHANTTAVPSDTYVIYVESSLPLSPSECDLLMELLNRRIAIGRASSETHVQEKGPVLAVTPALEWSDSGFGRGWQVSDCVACLCLLAISLPWPSTMSK